MDQLRPAARKRRCAGGDRWTFPWQFSDQGKTVYARVVNVFHGRDRIDYRQEYSLDRRHWTAMATGVETRQP
ncbi:MAG TPA: hypothetical protein VJR95_13245 [Rhodanobacter sp.]|nr:hypothetical protein [Rhodanobacter sp.]